MRICKGWGGNFCYVCFIVLKIVWCVFVYVYIIVRLVLFKICFVFLFVGICYELFSMLVDFIVWDWSICSFLELCVYNIGWKLRFDRWVVVVNLVFFVEKIVIFIMFFFCYKLIEINGRKRKVRKCLFVIWILYSG